MTFEELREKIQLKFDFNIILETPYKLCDFKPAYGYIFEEYIPKEKYMFWGHCDLDTIMGNFNDFITDDILKTYDKIFCLGHMILYKNDYENNRFFMKELKGKFLYKKVFSTMNICWFDETYNGTSNINTIFIENNKKVFLNDLSLNFDTNSNNLKRVIYYADNNSYEVEKYKEALYVWDSGKLYRIFLRDNKLVKENFLYAHFQSRKMKMDMKILKKNSFKILPNRFKPMEDIEINFNNFKKIKKSCISFHVIKMKVKRKIKQMKKYFRRK